VHCRPIRGVFLTPILIVAFAFMGSNVLAQDSAKRQCTRQEAIQAEKTVDSLKQWGQVYHSYRKYSQCDDGAIAEGYSDAIGKLLANDWSHFNGLLALTKTDKPFQEFVLRHIDETLSHDVLQKILNNARSKCPKGGEALCVLVSRSATPQ
jgi:hypothetical protein